MSTLSLVLHGAGLISVYTAHGYLRDKILLHTTYNGEHFTSAPFLNFFSHLCTTLIGLLVVLFYSRFGSGEREGEVSRSWRQRFVAKVTPTNHFLSYALVSVFGFLSHASQYGAWQYAPENIRAVSQTVKVIPVLFVGSLIFGKRYRVKDWISAFVFFIGALAYIACAPTSMASIQHSRLGDATSSSGLGFTGGVLLLSYLLMEGLTISTQEKLIVGGRKYAEKNEDQNPILDQMIWTSGFSTLIALEMALIGNSSGELTKNLLLLTSRGLLWDITLLSLVSAVGLVVLLSTIKRYGALSTSLLLSIRRTLLLLSNAHLLGSLTSTSVIGWCGVGWMFSALYIKLNKSYDSYSRRAELRKLAVIQEEIEELKLDMDGASSVGSGGSSTSGSEVGSPRLSASGDEGFGKPSEVVSESSRRSRQYLLPLLLPIVLSLIFTPIIQHGPRGMISSQPFYRNNMTLEGGQWEAEMHSQIRPKCWHNETTERYNADIKTAFASFPRSGNSFSRTLLERVTGYQTSSVYCDPSLLKTFAGECDYQSKFFIKTHFPTIPIEKPPGPPDYYKDYDQVFHLIRNPIDAITSWYQLDNVGLDADGNLRHDAKLDMLFTEENAGRMLDMAEAWRVHALYWTNAPILTHTMRYEDFRATPVTSIMSLLSFLLPQQALPSLSDLACMVEADGSHQAYRYRKHEDFSSWPKLDKALRQKVLKIVRRPFCSFGYDVLLRQSHGDVEELKDFCTDLKFLDSDRRYNLGWDEEDPALPGGGS